MQKAKTAAPQTAPRVAGPARRDRLAAALENAQFHARVVHSGKLYNRKKKLPRGEEEES